MWPYHSQITSVKNMSLIRMPIETKHRFLGDLSKIRKVLSLACILAVFLVTPCFAQNESITVDQGNLSELIETLENEAQRTDFVQNLKALQDAQVPHEEDDPLVPISEVLGLGSTVDDLVMQYNSFLEKNDLNSSTIGKSALTIGAFIVFLLFGVLVRKGGLSLRDRLLRLKKKFSLSHDRFRFYARMIRYSGYIIVTAVFIYTLGVIWGITDFAFLGTEFGTDIFGHFLSVLVVALSAVIIWEAINGFIEFGMRRSEGSSNRLRTLLPIVRNVMFIVFAVMFMLIVLSELGINIMPLLAGAGIFGIAIGFGAQTMVKDFLSGFTIILEDLIQVGDVAKLAGRTGFVEKITIRKVQLRDLDGAVYTIPFSEIDIIENLTKDYSYYLMDIGIAYREDTDEVMEYLKEIDEEMRNDNDFKHMILEPIEILGVDNFADSAVIIKARIKTRPIKQWVVGREFNRRMKYKFDEKGVEIPFPHQTVYFGADKKGHAPSAPVEIKGVDRITDSALENGSKTGEEKALV